MLHAPPDLDRLRTITDQALHGHHTLDTWHPPTPFVLISAAHLDVLLRTLDPEHLGANVASHNRTMNRFAEHTRCIEAITTAVGTLEAATRGDQTTVGNIARNLTRLTRKLQETHR